MSNVVLFIILGLGFAGFFAFVHYKFKSLESPKEEGSQKLMLQMLENLRQDLNQRQSENKEEIEKKLYQMTMMLKQQQTDTGATLQKQFQQSSEMIQQMTKNLTQVQEGTLRVANFAEQLKSLENILKSPKQRGILGEYALETLLSNHLHGNYAMQYKMANGEIVDAVIFFNNLTIPIDSKFSLEKYNQMQQATDPLEQERIAKEFRSDVKKRIDETAKYIRTSEGTTEFAFMFVPAEGIYYNLTIENVGSVKVNTQNLIEYAFSKRVIIVSPSSFFAYLQTVLQGLKALEMGENITRALKGIEVLGKHVNAYDDYFKRLGKHLGTTVNTYNHASREFKKIDKDIYKLTEGGIGGQIEVELLDPPHVED